MLFPSGLPVSKRIFDLILTSLGLILLSPSVLLTALSVRIFLGRPIFFHQQRPGYKGRPFFIYKFRTMTAASDSAGNLLPDSQRLTRLGRYSPEQMRRHDAYPGLTGWAQVNGRNAITWQDKFALDVWYVDHWSFWLDIKIILLTLWKVIKREGISQPGQATTEYFMGNDE
jgi:sugar transferase EpsL